MATPRVLLRSVTVPVEETTEVASKIMESAVRVIAAPEELVVMVPVESSIPVLLAPTPPVPVTETVPVPLALISPPETRYTP